MYFVATATGRDLVAAGGRRGTVRRRVHRSGRVTPLRIALTSYRSKPHSGGQGVYVRHLSQALTALGHSVEVFSGQPYPDLTEGVRLTRVPSLDLYADADPFRRPRLNEFRDWIDVLEYATMCTAGFPEPRTFSHRVHRVLASRAAQFDVVHDNQTLGYGMLGVARLGPPLVTTIHHPISRDRRIDLAQASARRWLTLNRWYGFVAMQRKVARRLDHVITVSQNSADDVVADFGVRRERIRIVPVGVDTELFRPPGGGPDSRVPGRIVTLCSADVPMKGLSVLLRATARLARDRAVNLVVVARPQPGGPTQRLIADLGLDRRVRFVSGLSEPDLAELIATAQVAVVPSLYEGFSLPAIEAMACGTPLIASDVAALPEVVGRDGRCGLLFPPGDDQALAATIGRVLDDPTSAARMGHRARERAVELFSWTSTARATVECYREAIGLAADSSQRLRTPSTGRLRTPSTGRLRTPSTGQLRTPLPAPTNDPILREDPC